MDLDAEIKRLENKRDFIKEYLAHSITVSVLKDSATEEEKAIHMICEIPVDSFSGFFAHFQLIGHLKGLRRSRSLFQDQLTEVEEEIRELKKEYATGNTNS